MRGFVRLVAIAMIAVAMFGFWAASARASGGVAGFGCGQTFGYVPTATVFLGSNVGFVGTVDADYAALSATAQPLLIQPAFDFVGASYGVGYGQAAVVNAGFRQRVVVRQRTVRAPVIRRGVRTRTSVTVGY